MSELEDKKQELRDYIGNIDFRIATATEVALKVLDLFLENRLTPAERLHVLSILHLFLYTDAANKIKFKHDQ